MPDRVPREWKEAIHFGTAARSLFGFYHPARNAWRGVGVVLCSPLGTDQTRSERAFRHLADALADAGFPCLRYDPFGTGDSGGDEQAPNLVQGWVEDVAVAAAELRARSGATTLSLVGLRLGGTIAIQAAERLELESLVLWNPCESGRAFLDEATKLHRVYLRVEPQLAGAEPTPAGGVEALGAFYPNPLVEGLAGLNPRLSSRRPARRALVIDGGGEKSPNVLDSLLGQLRALEVDAELRTLAGHKFLTTVPHAARVPDEVIESIVQWLSGVHPTTLGSASAVSAGAPAVAAAASETPVWFGARGTLFGILTPADPARARSERPPIVIANAGCVNHVGPHRTSVSMARRWAALGFDVLRLDLAGIGESATDGAAENLVYPPSALADLEAAIVALGGRRAIVAGLCSGGDYAFQMGIHSPNVVGSWMLNPRTFCVLDLTAVESDAGSAPPGNPVGDVPRSLRSMVEKGIRPVLVVSRGDPGIAYVDSHAPSEMGALKNLAGFERFDVSGADHTFTPVSAQRRVIELLTEHLVARY